MYIMESKLITLILGFTLGLGIYTIISPVGTCKETSGNIFYVDDNGGADYTSIQDAIYFVYYISFYIIYPVFY